MVLDKIEKKNLLQRFIWLILGKEKPNFLTRISVLAGFIVWIYLISWHILTVLAITLLDTVHNSSYVRATFTRVGRSHYDLVDTISQLLIHSLVQLVIFGIILIGLILIWRRKKMGFILLISAYLTTYIITFFVLGWDYLVNETSIFDFMLVLSTILYFLIGLLMFTRWKTPDNKSNQLVEA